MKDDLPYFSHDNDTRNHAKMKALRARFGWTGYGQFWALNEMIAGSSMARLDLSRKVVRAAAACELGMTTDALEDFLKFLADHEECGLIHYENGVITTDRTQEDYARTEHGRLHARARYEAKKATLSEKSETSPEKEPFTPCETIENRIEENREEYKREEGAHVVRFVRPSLEDISAYCQERKNRVDPQAWLDHYESNGWKVGKNAMKDWRAAVRTWERGDFGKPATSTPSYSSTPSLKPVTMTPEEREMYARTYQRGDK